MNWFQWRNIWTRIGWTHITCIEIVRPKTPQIVLHSKTYRYEQYIWKCDYRKRLTTCKPTQWRSNAIPHKGRTASNREYHWICRMTYRNRWRTAHHRTPSKICILTQTNRCVERSKHLPCQHRDRFGYVEHHREPKRWRWRCQWYVHWPEKIAERITHTATHHLLFVWHNGWQSANIYILSWNCYEWRNNKFWIGVRIVKAKQYPTMGIVTELLFHQERLFMDARRTYENTPKYDNSKFIRKASCQNNSQNDKGRRTYTLSPFELWIDAWIITKKLYTTKIRRDVFKPDGKRKPNIAQCILQCNFK